ncbi:MAG: GNAT family protein [Nanoarchaeota archaeon]
MTILKGKGFILRDWKDGDQKSLVENANNKKIWLNLTDIFPRPYTLKDANKWIEINSKGKKDYLNLTIVVNGKTVGDIGIHKKSGNSQFTAILGYWIGEKYWGKGIMTKAVKLFCNHVFKKFKVKRIEAKAFTLNPGSRKVLEKSGFKYEGTLRKSVFKNERLIDEWIFGKIISD